MRHYSAVYAIVAVLGITAGGWGWSLLFVALAWAVRALVWPFTPCWMCEGRKTNYGSTRKRFGKCLACKGSGTRQVLGSRQLARAVRSVMRRQR